MRLVYGRSPQFDALVLLTEDEATGMAEDFAALQGAATWREAAAVKTRVLWNPAASRLEDHDLDDPDGDWDEPVALDDLVDGDGVWPPPLPFFSDECLPEEVTDKFGELVEPSMSSAFSLYGQHEESAILDAPRGQGYLVRRDDVLIPCLEPMRLPRFG